MTKCVDCYLNPLLWSSKTMKYYDPSHNRLVFIEKQATPEFWDDHWDAKNLREIIISGGNDRFILDTTKKYLNTGRVLEGGCGVGSKVYALYNHGYDAYGVDFATKTVGKINASVPDLKILPADVMHLPFRSSTFDGYWSLGVIEHFYAGYGPIADEMARVLKPEGILFLTFPFMSLLRRLKAKAGLYPQWDETYSTESFYLLLMDRDEIIKGSKKREFKILESRLYGGIKGFKDKFQIVKPLLQRFYNYSGKSVFIRMTRQALNKLLELFADHMTLLVLKKIESTDSHE